MMTVKHARRFREKVRDGERPDLPECFHYALSMTGWEILAEIRRAHLFDYGTRMRNDAHRLQQMGILDEHFDLTEVGREYLARL